MNGKIHRQPQGEGGEHRNRHVIVLAYQADDSVDQGDGDRKRHHGDYPPEGRAEQKSHHEKDDHKTAHKGLEHAGDHLVLPDHVQVGEAGPLVDQWPRRRLVNEKAVNFMDDLFHVLVVAAFELYPDIGLLVVRSNKMEKIVRLVTVLIGDQGLRNSGRRFRHPEIFRLAFKQFLMHFHDDIGDRIALADNPGCKQMVLKRLHIAEHGRLLEKLSPVADPVQDVQDIRPEVVIRVVFSPVAQLFPCLFQGRNKGGG